MFAMKLTVTANQQQSSDQSEMTNKQRPPRIKVGCNWLLRSLIMPILRAFNGFVDPVIYPIILISFIYYLQFWVHAAVGYLTIAFSTVVAVTCLWAFTRTLVFLYRHFRFVRIMSWWLWLMARPILWPLSFALRVMSKLLGLLSDALFMLSGINRYDGLDGDDDDDDDDDDGIDDVHQDVDASTQTLVMPVCMDMSTQTLATLVCTDVSTQTLAKPAKIPAYEGVVTQYCPALEYANVSTQTHITRAPRVIQKANNRWSRLAATCSNVTYAPWYFICRSLGIETSPSDRAVVSAAIEHCAFCAEKEEIECPSEEQFRSKLARDALQAAGVFIYELPQDDTWKQSLWKIFDVAVKNSPEFNEWVVEHAGFVQKASSYMTELKYDHFPPPGFNLSSKPQRYPDNEQISSSSSLRLSVDHSEEHSSHQSADDDSVDNNREIDPAVANVDVDKNSLSELSKIMQDERDDELIVRPQSRRSSCVEDSDNGQSGRNSNNDCDRDCDNESDRDSDLAISPATGRTRLTLEQELANADLEAEYGSEPSQHASDSDAPGWGQDEESVWSQYENSQPSATSTPSPVNPFIGDDEIEREGDHEAGDATSDDVDSFSVSPLSEAPASGFPASEAPSSEQGFDSALEELSPTSLASPDLPPSTTLSVSPLSVESLEVARSTTLPPSPTLLELAVDVPLPDSPVAEEKEL